MENDDAGTTTTGDEMRSEDMGTYTTASREIHVEEVGATTNNRMLNKCY